MRLPDKKGHFGFFGGQYVPETLMSSLMELEKAYWASKKDREFQRLLLDLWRDYAGRPTPLYYAQGMTNNLKGCRIYLKREDLLHTGAHKINNTLGQALLARKMGKKRIIAETGAGQHGVATATAAALLGLSCTVYMGEEDVQRQSLNVFRMRLLGAEVIPVSSGSQTLKDAINEALRDWVTNVQDAYYLIGSVVGPHPYPMIVRDYQAIIGREVKKQVRQREGRLPDVLVACVGGGSNALGLFYPFLNDEVKLVGVEAAGLGLETGKHAASLTAGSIGMLHGCMSYILQDLHGNIKETHSISAGLDYPGVGPEHAYLRESGRAEYVTATDEEALEAFFFSSKTDGILPALESAHALAYARKIAGQMSKDQIMVVNLSGRGDKDVQSVAKKLGVAL